MWRMHNIKINILCVKVPAPKSFSSSLSEAHIAEEAEVLLQELLLLL